MFLRFQPTSSVITYVPATPSESEYEMPSSIERFQTTTPTKSVNGPKAGPAMVASWLEAINCRKNFPRALVQSKIDDLIARAQALDAECEGYETIEDSELICSDEGYVSFFNFMKAVSENSNLVNGTLEWTNSLARVKQMVHQRGVCLVEIHLTSTLANLTSFDVTSAGVPLIHDYTKVLLACGLDQTGLICQNSLGLSWGNLGFCRIAWPVLNQTLEFDDFEPARMFLKACSFKDQLNGL